MALYNNLRAIREEMQLSQEQLAVAIGTCSRTISRLERSERNPSLEVAIRLAQFLDKPVEEIFNTNPNFLQK